MSLKRSARWGLAACAVGLVVGAPMAVRQMSTAPARAAEPSAPAPAPTNEARAVRIEHEFITLSPAAPLDLGAPISAPALRAVQPVRRAVIEPRTFSAKTKRALLGDGRYRPEPFPRAR